jgi:uncharacterized protein (UPF0332 family)
MADWQKLGTDCLRTTQKLLELSRSTRSDSHLRSLVSRAYYAVFSVAAFKLAQKVTFREGREGPTHAALPKLVKSNLTALAVSERRDLSRIIRRLYSARLDADYSPGITVDLHSARQAYFQALDAFRFLGVQS